MIDILLSLAPFGVIIALGGVAIYFWYQGEQKRRAQMEERHAEQLRQLRKTNEAQANPLRDAKSANDVVRSRRGK